MAIKASPVTPTRHEFACDPEGESWVDILPVTSRMDEIRGSLLSVQEVRWDDNGYPIRRTEVNPYQLMVEEMRLTFGGANIVIESEEGKPLRLFTADPMTRGAFMEDLEKLPREARIEWGNAVRNQNMAWLYPF